jgi:DNA-binding transcriptional MerR regulator
MSYTVTRLARACALSRSTVLYYESIGLLKRPRRTSGNYRLYGDADLDRLRQVCAYRDAGLKLSDIQAVLDAPKHQATEVLRRRFFEIAGAIERLREHQRSIARLLETTNQIRRLPMVTKDKWKEIMQSAGFTEDDMQRWHAEFERAAPNEHQEFLEFLHIPKDQIERIRTASRPG